MQDANLMFENAKLFNEDESQIYRDAVTLQVCHILDDPTFQFIKTDTLRREKLRD